MRRPPRKQNQFYLPAFEQMLGGHRGSNDATTLAGVRNKTTWGKISGFWLGEYDLRELPDPHIPTFKKGATTDAILIAPGEYIVDGISPTKQEIGQKREIRGY